MIVGRKLAAAMVSTSMAALMLAAGASADSVTVDTGGIDTSGCTLQEAAPAVAAGVSANGCTVTSGGTADTVGFAPGLTAITLSGGPVDVNDDDPIDIVGPGMGSLQVSGDTGENAFSVSGGTTASISGLTVEDSDITGTGLRGGCVYVGNGDLTLTNVRVTECTLTGTGSGAQFADGSAVAVQTGSVALDHSLVDNNTVSATNNGNTSSGAYARGAIFGESGTTVDLTDTTVAGNTATATDDGSGEAQATAGVYANEDADIIKSTISGNTATANQSGGDPGAAAGALTAGVGGVVVELSTIANNISDVNNAAGTKTRTAIRGVGGGLAIRSSTLAFNGPTSTAAPVDGANLITQGATIVVRNSILSDPRGGGLNCAGTINSQGFNIDYSAGGQSCFAPPLASDLPTNPLLGVLGGNGGPTETIPLPNNSPAIDAGNNSFDTNTTDQRELARPVEFSGLSNAAGGNGSDIGAFEVQQACSGEATPGATCPSGPAPVPPAPHKKKCKKHKKGKKASAAKKKCKKTKRKK